MTAITHENLQCTVDRINRILGTASEPYKDGEPQAFCYFLDVAYGRIALHQFGGSGTGECDTFGAGHMSKHELMARMHAFIDGIYAARGRAHGRLDKGYAK